MKKKSLAIVLALVLALTCVVGGSLAWLKLKTDPVQNTFTFGNIGLDLSETPNQKYVVIPGQPITKDPKVTVTTPDGFEPVESYVFVKVEKSAQWPAELTYTIEGVNGWKKLDVQDAEVYYQVVTPATGVGTQISVLKDNQVLVADSLDKATVDKMKDVPTHLNFTAYAIQKAGFDDVNVAWKEVSKQA